MKWSNLSVLVSFWTQALFSLFRDSETERVGNESKSLPSAREPPKFWATRPEDLTVLIHLCQCQVRSQLFYLHLKLVVDSNNLKVQCYNKRLSWLCSLGYNYYRITVLDVFLSISEEEDNCNKFKFSRGACSEPAFLVHFSLLSIRNCACPSPTLLRGVRSSLPIVPRALSCFPLPSLPTTQTGPFGLRREPLTHSKPRFPQSELSAIY